MKECARKTNGTKQNRSCIENDTKRIHERFDWYNDLIESFYTRKCFLIEDTLPTVPSATPKQIAIGAK